MSEKEKLKRAGYRKRRRIALTTLAILLAVVTLATVAFAAILNRKNETLYIDYTEEGRVDYTISLKDNDFYGTTSLPSGQSYVASLIDAVNATFRYEISIDADDVNYEYSYWLNTQLVITDRATGKEIYNPTYTVKDKQTLSNNSSAKLTIFEAVSLDYEYYNTIAEQFTETYGLSDVQCALVTRMHVEVLSLCDEFKEDAETEYVIALNVPLTAKTVNVQMSSSVPNTSNKILACENSFNAPLYTRAVTAGAITDVILLAALVLTALLTRNKDITYSIKVKRLLAAYRSFIQRITNPFAKDGYQVLTLSTFQEMLEIRDTINSPVLMYENDDKTCTEFIIPTAQNLIYLYELKVADYDEIYGAESSDSEGSADATSEADAYTEGADIDFEASMIPMDDTLSDFNFGRKYDYSFEARLSLAGDEAREYWQAIVTYARSYGAKVARSWSRERIYFGRNLFAIIIFKGKKLALAFAKDPATANSKYFAVDMSEVKKFSRTPMLMVISSQRRVKFATEILDELFTAAGLSDKKEEVKVTVSKKRSKEKLLSAGLIRSKS